MYHISAVAHSCDNSLVNEGALFSTPHRTDAP